VLRSKQLGGVEWCPDASSKQLGKQPDEAMSSRQSRQLGKQPDEPMSSSRGDARATKRARTGGAKTAPREDQRILEQNQCVLR
jgi:hypothetical protein